MTKKNKNLDELYEAPSGQTFMTGIQALVRLPMAQRNLDRTNGLKTAGLVTGYRGSPLGAYDQQLWKAEGYLADHDIVFQPGLNEDLAATALWGAQMHKAYGPSDVEGVFGIWYGKGNGVDRTGDVFRNANTIGTSALGGVLAVGGDDHAAQSSMFPHQTDGIFQSVMMPVLQPSSVSEILTLGLAGIAMSRYSGLWVAMKTIAEVVESAATFALPDLAPIFKTPDMPVPPRGFGWDPAINWPAERAEYERRMVEERLPAAIAWAKANRLDHPVITPKAPKLVIVTVGKAHQDVMQAFENLGISEAAAKKLGIGVYKVAMSWPLVTDLLIDFASGAEEILVVEEKTAIVEDQLKAALYNRAGAHPRVIGKTDEQGKSLLPVILEFTPRMVASAIMARLGDAAPATAKKRHQAMVGVAKSAEILAFPKRKPFFCSGCPHNSSTKTPDGSISGGGIGCHVMALSVPKLKTATFSQMGGEGMQWVGAAPFSKTGHIFQNIGDGTYQHSGLLAIRAAVASKANITFKILYNDAVAMTGGQPAEGAPEPVGIVKQLLAEGVGEVHLVSDDPQKWQGQLPQAAKIHHRDDMDSVQKTLRTVPGATAIVYEQTCAAEKRRRRKRGAFPDPAKRLFINPRVCEGCGDCSVQSNCIAVEPLETDFGRKRKINQSSCNKDFSCVKGFCPSFVEVDGPVLRKPDANYVKGLEERLFAGLPTPVLPQLGDTVYNVYVAGIGGLGVLTTGSLIATAAFRAGLNSTVLDFTGLAQKNGAVVSQVRLAAKDHDIHAVRVGEGEANLILGTDLVVAASDDAVKKMGIGSATVVLNSDIAPTADIVTDRDAAIPATDMINTLMKRAKTGYTLKATRIAEGLFGNNIAANMMMLGYAWQQGLIPVTAETIFNAIEINGAAVDLNKRAFMWGRLVAVDPVEVEKVAGIYEIPVVDSAALNLESLISKRTNDLVEYQNKAYADRYQALIARVKHAVSGMGDEGEAFIRAVAVNAYKLMAYKDEYEVARLYSEPAFMENLKAQFASTEKLSIWLAPPLLTRTDPKTGRPAKMKFGPWVFSLFKILAQLKGLRGTWADPFGKTHERRMERALVQDYFETVDSLLQGLREGSIKQATDIAALPDMIRGYGPVKEEAIGVYKKSKSAFISAFKGASKPEHEQAA
ncbi:indolepyruvate ferredoxin oxidoreductase family protein [Kordiimonas pumila]|uniref:Indolepyruvate ferredoxin oxidoreductase family protein n=1 Tax=Kordiimonas pumila TaxID=2161677 RepID=A0ABV7D7A7_9PROT|nr:indolepyruvate ferredoxin oxidoreductase family protein [Kordiimonas pumila]